MRYAFNKMKLLVMIILTYLGGVYFLNTVAYQSGYYDDNKITNSKHPINLQIDARFVRSVDYTYTQVVDRMGDVKKTFETHYFLHIYEQNNKYFFIMSENGNLKNRYFTTTILSNEYMNDIYSQLVLKKDKDIEKIIKNFSMISLVERNDIKLTNHYYLPLWQVVEDKQINEVQNNFDYKIQNILAVHKKDTSYLNKIINILK